MSPTVVTPNLRHWATPSGMERATESRMDSAEVWPRGTRRPSHWTKLAGLSPQANSVSSRCVCALTSPGTIVELECSTTCALGRRMRRALKFPTAWINPLETRMAPSRMGGALMGQTQAAQNSWESDSTPAILHVWGNISNFPISEFETVLSG